MSLVVEGLRAGYGGIPVLHGVSLEVREGEVVALLGRNGAGKTTLIKAVMGLVRTFSGRVRYRGVDLTPLPPFRRAREGLGYVPDDRRIFPEPTVRENLLVAARTMEPREGLRSSPPSPGDPAPPGRPPLRGGTADAHHRPDSHDQSPPTPPG